MEIEFRGEIVSGADSGSELRGSASAPFGLHGFDWAFIAAWFLIVVVLSQGQWPWALATIGVLSTLLAPVWLLIIRHNQRMALGNVNDLARTIASIIKDGGRVRTAHTVPS